MTARRNADVELFEGLYSRWRDTVAGRLRDDLTALLDPAYVFTSPEGARMERASVVELEMLIPPPESVRIDSVQWPSDEIAIVRGSNLVKGAFPAGSIGDGLAERMRAGLEIAFTSVWRKSADGWVVLSNDAHVTAGEG